MPGCQGLQSEEQTETQNSLCRHPADDIFDENDDADAKVFSERSKLGSKAFHSIGGMDDDIIDEKDDAEHANADADPEVFKLGSKGLRSILALI